MSEFTTYLSDRGIPLLLNYEPTDQPIVTVENYLKWYSLFVVYPNGLVLPLPFDDEAEAWVIAGGESAYSDHSFNLKYAIRAAENADAFLHNEAAEMILGRWRLDVLEEAYDL